MKPRAAGPDAEFPPGRALRARSWPLAAVGSQAPAVSRALVVSRLRTSWRTRVRRYGLSLAAHGNVLNPWLGGTTAATRRSPPSENGPSLQGHVRPRDLDRIPQLASCCRESRTLVNAVWRIVTAAVCLLVALGMRQIILRTRFGMRVRAGATNAEMVEALGIDVPLLLQ